MTRVPARGSLRLRLTLLSAGVFFVVGAGLLALTYVLVLTTVPRQTPAQALETQQVLVCRQQELVGANASPAIRVRRPVPPGAVLDRQAFCRNVLSETAAIGATADRARTLHGLLVYSAIGLVAMTLVAAGAAWTLSGRALRPLRDITKAAARASRETLREPLAIPAESGELNELAETFDGMLNRLDASFAAQERFVADASHELRTPLATVGAVLDVAMAKGELTRDQLDHMAADIRGQLAQANSLIDALLLLSRSDAGAVASEPIDLAGLAREACAERAVGFKVECDLPTAPVRADRLLLQRVVANLVDNAVVHNDRRRWIRASTFCTDAEAGLTVESTGRAIPETEATRLFGPFYRAAARTGTGHGLGLAIVRSVALAHGGRCEAVPRHDGGLAVTVVLPRGL